LFCDHAKPRITTDEGVIDFRIQRDRENLVLDTAQNEFGKENCGPDWLDQGIPS
jgi:hypothetical protein